MLISDAIKKLTDFQNQFGDLPICIYRSCMDGIFDGEHEILDFIHIPKYEYSREMIKITMPPDPTFGD